MIRHPEVWKLVGYPGQHHYEVSNAGRVRRAIWRGDRYRTSHEGRRWRYLWPTLSPDGYRIVVLSHGDGGRSQYLLHRLVWETFEADVPEGMVVTHKDGDRSNCAIDNLQLIQRSAVGEKLRGRLRPEISGENHPSASIDEATARAIKERLAEAPRLRSTGRLRPGTCVAISHDLGVAQSVVHNIAQGRTWRHV